MKQKVKQKKKKVVGYNVSLTVDGQVFNLFIEKKSHLNEFLEKRHLKGITCNFSEVFEDDKPLSGAIA